MNKYHKEAFEKTRLAGSIAAAALNQVSKIIDINKTRVVYNSSWLNKLDLGKIISIAIVGYNKKPGTPYPSIQLIVPSILKILLYAEIKNKAEIRSLPRRSIKFAI